MAASTTFLNRLGKELVPSVGQALLAVAAATILVVAGRSASILRTFGVTPEGVAAAGQPLRQQFDLILGSVFANNLILIIFWASVGVIVYLVCWAIYGAYISARNEVTININYVNTGRWQGPWATMVIKAVCATGLVIILASFQPGNILWQLMAAPFFTAPSLDTVLGLTGAIGGLALQLYLLLVTVLLTFTPWYHENVFTD